MLVPNFVGPSYTSQSPNADAELCMNWYVENLESAGAKVPQALYPCPGFETFAEVVQSPVRGMFATGGLTNRLFAVIGFKIYEIDSGGTATDRGTVAFDGYPATFATNSAAGDQMMITSGGVLYCYELSSNVVTEITAFSGATIPIRSVAFLDGFFLALDAVNSAFYCSDLNDGQTWDLTQVATRTAGADPWIAMAVITRQIWLLGTLTSEVWYNAGTSPFPFAPFPGGFLEQGCAAGFSLVNLDSTLVWVGQNANGRGVVYRSNGFTPQRISTHAVEFAISNYGDISGAISFSYQDQGHSFCVITFPGSGTWVFDTITGLWHQRGQWDADVDQFLPLPVTFQASAFQQQFVGSSSLGTIYTMSIDASTDVNGEGVRRVRRTAHQWDGNSLNRVFFPGMQIDMQTGIGLSGGALPEVMLNWSDDGGYTYPVELQQAASAGALGASKVRVLFLQLGQSRDRVWQLVCSDAVPWRILQAVYRPDPVLGVS